MAVDFGDEIVGGLADGFQAGFQLRQFLPAAPMRNIDKAVGAGLYCKTYSGLWPMRGRTKMSLSGA